MFTLECWIDLNFIVDSSGSILWGNPDNWDISLRFVADVVREFTIGPNDVQVAFVLFSHIATVEWGLTRYDDQEELIDAILNMRFLGYRTNLNDAIYLSRTEVSIIIITYQQLIANPHHVT